MSRLLGFLAVFSAWETQVLSDQASQWSAATPVSGLTAQEHEAQDQALAQDDECRVDQSGQTSGHCSMEFLQRLGHIQKRAASEEQEDWGYIPPMYNNYRPSYYQPQSPWGGYMPGWGVPGGAAPGWGVPGPGAPSASPPAPPSPAAQPQATTCSILDAEENSKCKEPIEWIAKDGKYDPKAAEWFQDMQLITGVDRLQATKDDFQRMYFCSPPGGKACRSPPCSCSKPPCNTCFGGGPQGRKRPGCTADSTSIDCKPPSGPMDYKGMTWPTITVDGTQEMHIFAIGDWGGMDGSLNPIEGRPELVAYSWGKRKGASVFPRTRWNIHHTVELCSHKQFIECFQSKGSSCPSSCGYVPGVDDQPQQLVAKAMKDRAQTNEPQYILNVGDNFYWGGIEKTCGTPMDQMSWTAHHQFDQIFEQMYTGPGLDDKPWLSVLGNHDWGGRQFNNGWDQQIAYTWASPRWIMPAPYYMVHVDYAAKGFSVDIFMVDTNVFDAKSPPMDSEHNLCGSAHNPADANCGAIGGPTSIMECPSYFQTLWGEQKVWLTNKLSQSQATWQIMVTHFPCGQDGAGQGFYRELYTKGLDLMVTGHRHDQELWLPTDPKNRMGGFCIVTGGGGGITSEATPNPADTRDWYGEGEYGFYDITIDARQMLIESINYDGKVLKTGTVYPRR